MTSVSIPTTPLLDLEKVLAVVSPEEIPNFLAELERLKALAWCRLQGIVTSNRLLTLQEVAERLAVPVSKVYELARHEGFPVTMVGKYKRVSERDLATWQAQQKKAVDSKVYITYSPRHERRRTATDSEEAGAHSARPGGPRRGRLQHDRPAGTGGAEDHGACLPPHQAAG